MYHVTESNSSQGTGNHTNNFPQKSDKPKQEILLYRNIPFNIQNSYTKFPFEDNSTNNALTYSPDTRYFQNNFNQSKIYPFGLNCNNQEITNNEQFFDYNNLSNVKCIDKPIKSILRKRNDNIPENMNRQVTFGIPIQKYVAPDNTSNYINFNNQYDNQQCTMEMEPNNLIINPNNNVNNLNISQQYNSNTNPYTLNTNNNQMDINYPENFNNLYRQRENYLNNEFCNQWNQTKLPEIQYNYSNMEDLLKTYKFMQNNQRIPLSNSNYPYYQNYNNEHQQFLNQSDLTSPNNKYNDFNNQQQIFTTEQMSPNSNFNYSTIPNQQNNLQYRPQQCQSEINAKYNEMFLNNNIKTTNQVGLSFFANDLLRYEHDKNKSINYKTCALDAFNNIFKEQPYVKQWISPIKKVEKEDIKLPSSYIPNKFVISRRLKIPSQFSDFKNQHDIIYYFQNKFEIFSDVRAFTPTKIKVNVFSLSIEISGVIEYYYKENKYENAILRNYQLPYKIIPEQTSCFLHYDGILIISVLWNS